jgi:hypothetical protein
MVEMKMRVDDDIDLCRISVDRFESRADIFARPEGEREQTGDARSDSRGGVVLAIGMQSGVEEDPPFGMLDQVSGYRQVRPTLSALHQAAEIPGQPAASQGKEFHTQISLLNCGIF